VTMKEAFKGGERKGEELRERSRSLFSSVGITLVGRRDESRECSMEWKQDSVGELSVGKERRVPLQEVEWQIGLIRMSERIGVRVEVG
jgi:hypothetical protein